MRVTLIGADFEENLGVGMIAAAAEAAGHRVRILAFNDTAQIPALADDAVARRTEVVGLSIQFQHRAHEFLALARRLREIGYRGHITCGGQFSTLAWRDVISRVDAVDSLVLHEGEETFPALLGALATGAPLGEVPGLAIRDNDGSARRTASRGIASDLDALPFPLRYRPHTRHFGVPFVPIMGSRGCWGACEYCSITSFYRDARRAGGGHTFRERSPEDVAREMAAVWHAAGEDCLYCFHDDTFLRPKPESTLKRLRAIRAHLDDLGVGRIGIIGKCRPDNLTPALARELHSLGVIRLYVGVENASPAGSEHLNRGRQTAHVDVALRACREAGIFVCYNLLLFEPEATTADVAANIAFIRDHADHPINFCRAEPYSGTPLMLGLEARQALSGSFLGWDYRIEDSRAELMFRICAAAFRQRNFDPGGVANRYMGLGYAVRVLEHFYDDPLAERGALAVRARALTRTIALDTADHLEAALELANSLPLDDADRAARETAVLGLRISAADRVLHGELDAIFDDLDQFAAAARRSMPRRRPPGALLRGAARVAMGATLWASGAGCIDSTVVDPVPADAGRDTSDVGRPDFLVADPLPADAGRDGLVADPLPPDAGRDGLVADPPPADAGRDAWVVDPPPADAGLDAWVVDPVPPDAARPDMMVVDPPPPDAGRPDFLVADPLPPDAGMGPGGSLDPPSVEPERPIDQWRDTAPRRAARDPKLPLYAPPEVRLSASTDGERLRVALIGGPVAVSTRWESDGVIEGEGRAVVWTPAADDDQLRVAVRSRGGVAVVAVRARDLAR